MRKISFSFIFVFVFILSLKSQISSSSFDEDQYVYWFYIKAEIKTSKELKKPVYVVRRLGKSIKSGTYKEYIEEVWHYIKTGNQLTIGLFLELGNAKQANEMYHLSGKTNEQMEKEIENTIDTLNDSYYWYVLKFSKSDRTNKYLINRQPARVAEGTLKDFRYFMWSSLVLQQLAIGPFLSLIEAEESKRIYRLEEYKFHKQYKKLFK